MAIYLLIGRKLLPSVFLHVHHAIAWIYFGLILEIFHYALLSSSIYFPLIAFLLILPFVSTFNTTFELLHFSPRTLDLMHFSSQPEHSSPIGAPFADMYTAIASLSSPEHSSLIGAPFADKYTNSPSISDRLCYTLLLIILLIKRMFWRIWLCC